MTTTNRGKQISDFDLNDCNDMLTSKIKNDKGIWYINPSTGAKIKKDGPKYNEIIAHCETLPGFSRRSSFSSAMSPPRSPSRLSASRSSMRLSPRSPSRSPTRSPKVSTSAYSQFPEKIAVFTFGRFQPPTIGHKVLIDNVIHHANSIGGDHFIFASMSMNKKFTVVPEASFESNKTNENPLDIGSKIYYMHKMFPYANIIPMRTIPNILDFLRSQGYNKIIMLTGSDRDGAFNHIKGVEKYGVGNKRDANANGIEGISGTKMRVAAVKQDYNRLKNGVYINDMTEDDVKNMMNQIRISLGYNEVFYGGRRKY
jgi:hypothetical protein